MKLHALALAGLVALAPMALAQSECSKTKSECSKAKAELASADGECSTKAKAATLASADGECSTKAKAACSTATLASAGDGECSAKEKAECAKATLATAADGECSAEEKAACSKAQAAKLATAGGEAECSKAAVEVVIPASAQLASLFQPERVAGVVVDGKAYLGSKAIAVVEGLMEECLASKIKENCEASRACEKTLAANVKKAMAGKVCTKTQLSGLLAAGRIDSIIVDDESITCSKTAEATLASLTSCEEFQAECAKRAGVVVAPIQPIETASYTPVSVRTQLAALVDTNRIGGVVVDGKAYMGSEASEVLAKLIRGNVASEIKANCAESAACEKTLASNVDKALAGQTCAGGQLASLIECGTVESVLVGDTVLKSCEAKAAVEKIMACEKFQAHCRELATVTTVSETTCSKSLQ